MKEPMYDTKEQHLESARFYWNEAKKRDWPPFGYTRQALRHFLRYLGLPETWCFPSEEKLRKLRQRDEERKLRQQRRP